MKRLSIIGVLALLIDIISKLLVINLMNEYESIKVIENFFSLTYVKNTGVAFSLLDGMGILIIIVTIVILYFLGKYLWNNKVSKIDSIGYGLIIGGAVGNLIDRVVYGYVIDFFDFKIFGYDYPVFNLADTFIVIGVIILLFFSGRSGLDDKDRS
jgi:signal peptidase II